MSKAEDPHVDESSVEQCSETRSEATCTPLIDTLSDNESLNAASIEGLEPGRRGLDPSDARGVARINPLSEVGCNSDSFDVDNDIGSRIEHDEIERMPYRP